MLSISMRSKGSFLASASLWRKSKLATTSAVGSFLQHRDMSSDTKGSDQNSWYKKVTGPLTPHRLKTVAAGGAVFVVGASTILYEVGSGFMQLTPYATGYYGFIIGVATTAGASMAFNRFVSILHLSPEAVKERVVDFLKVNTFVQHAFNGDIMLSDMIGYRSGAGHLSVKNRSLVWSPTFVEIVVAIRGANNVEGVVTAVATKSLKGTNLGSICVHIDKMEPRFIIGDEDSLVYHKKMARMVSVKIN